MHVVRMMVTTQKLKASFNGLFIIYKISSHLLNKSLTDMLFCSELSENHNKITANFFSQSFNIIHCMFLRKKYKLQLFKETVNFILWISNPFKANADITLKPGQIICSASRSTGFFMKGRLAING